MAHSKILLSLAAAVAWLGCTAAVKHQWKVNDVTRPHPPVVTPGATDNAPPSDAVVLFDGTDLSHWKTDNGSPAGWKVENGYMEVVPKSGTIHTDQAFGSCQLHVEWAEPEVVKGNGQERGNSGIFLMGHYEVQVLDCYDNPTYADGQTGAIYGQKPPLVNACRKPGQWQTYDIIFHAPVFEGDKVKKPATVTVIQNGVLVQDHWVIEGSTFHKKRAVYEPHPAKLPLQLQDHGNPVRFRNIWIRNIPDDQK